MATKVTLDDIRAAAEAKYGSFDIELGEGRTLIMRNPLRLTKAERAELGDLQSDVNKDDETESADQEEVFAKIITLVAANKATAEEFLAAVGDDLTVLVETIQGYQKAAQMGEASASAN